MMIGLLILSLFSFEVPALEVFCFSKNTSLSSVKQHLSAITSPRDKVYLRESNNCLEIKTSAQKKELIEKWISKKYRIERNYNLNSGSEAVVTGTCRLAIEKVFKESSKDRSFSVGKKNNIKEVQILAKGKSVSSLVLGTGSSGEIRVNGQRVKLTCIQAGNHAYQVRVGLITPTQLVNTQVRVNKLAKVSLGGIVEDLSRKTTVKGIPTGYQKSKKTGSSSYDFYLIAR